LKLFSIKNTVSDVVEEVDIVNDTRVMPSLKDKTVYRKWANTPSTNHVFYSMTQGRHKAMRVGKENEPSKIHGVIADYDANIPDATFKSVLSNLPADCPLWVHTRTFSNGVRFVFKFQDAVPFYSYEFYDKFIKHVGNELGLDQLLPGLDHKALINPLQYYERGTRVVEVDHSAQVKTTLLFAWIEKLSKNFSWSEAGDIPLDAVAEEVEKRWPGVWPGGIKNFSEGVRGPNFWDGGKNPTAAIVRPGGMQSFSREPGWFTWETLLGSKFVRRFKDTQLGKAVERSYFDGLSYWRLYEDGIYRNLTETAMSRYLHVERGLSNLPPRKGQPSELDRAKSLMDTVNRIDGVFPFLYKEPGVVESHRDKILNISRVECMQPSGVPQDLLMPDFPWVWSWLSGFFDPSHIQLDRFLAWLAFFYRQALESDLRQGLAIFLAGPVGIGKSFLSDRILTPMFGGSEDASKYLQGGDQFNDNLFRAPIWTVDDAEAEQGSKHRTFSAMIKATVANPNLRYRPMYKSGVTRPWMGRVVVTMNDDPESLRMLPTVDNSILDKICLFKVKDSGVQFPLDIDLILEKELPHFCQFLLEWSVPDHCIGSSRFGSARYIHKDLLNESQGSSETSSFYDLLHQWMEGYCDARGECRWEGSGTQLLREFATDGALEGIAMNYRDPQKIGRFLAQLAKQKTGPGDLKVERLPRTNRGVIYSISYTPDT